MNVCKLAYFSVNDLVEQPIRSMISKSEFMKNRSFSVVQSQNIILIPLTNKSYRVSKWSLFYSCFWNPIRWWRRSQGCRDDKSRGRYIYMYI